MATKQEIWNKKWEKTKAKGKTNYILKTGVLYWGLTTAVLLSVIMHFISPEEKWYMRPLIALVVYPIVGIFHGWRMWRYKERMYLTNKAV